MFTVKKIIFLHHILKIMATSPEPVSTTWLGEGVREVGKIGENVVSGINPVPTGWLIGAISTAFVIFCIIILLTWMVVKGSKYEGDVNADGCKIDLAGNIIYQTYESNGQTLQKSACSRPGENNWLIWLVGFVLASTLAFGAGKWIYGIGFLASNPKAAAVIGTTGLMSSAIRGNLFGR